MFLKIKELNVFVIKCNENLNRFKTTKDGINLKKQLEHLIIVVLKQMKSRMFYFVVFVLEMVEKKIKFLVKTQQ